MRWYLRYGVDVTVDDADALCDDNDALCMRYALCGAVIWVDNLLVKVRLGQRLSPTAPT